LAYLFEDAASVPRSILKLLGLDENLLAEKENMLLREFENYRQEKNIIETIKYKAEIIKANKEEWMVLEKAVRVLVLGKEEKEGGGFRYKKHRHLDLSNIKKIIAKGVGLTEVPSWLRECHNLKVLKLERNKITAIQKEELPLCLTDLNLWENALKAVDISALSSLMYLNVANNFIGSFSLGLSSSLVRLDLSDNELSSFDMGSNRSLTHLHLKNNQLNSFDIGENSCLLELNLQFNQLVSVNLRNAGSLVKLTICYNPELGDLYYLPPSL
jgi:hypothetical protein